ncbi:uncharacterized protein LOC132903765 [Amyelois transitella]|uniref:uncharacterized protein LOC132903765 n=1 Tax=Amyelois transitella TaxID=680683 RepID=UPI00299016CB|nr:uncharacterized protein LOC132903765 [Amyelois transitella]
MNSIYVIVVFLCLQELTGASYYRIPKRYFKSPRQERKQIKNIPQKIPARNKPIFVALPEKAQIVAEEIAEPDIALSLSEKAIIEQTVTQKIELEIDGIISKDETTPDLKNHQPVTKYKLPDDIVVQNLKTYQPVLKYELPKMTALPILTILPIVAALPVVNVKPRSLDVLPDSEIVDDGNLSGVDKVTPSEEVGDGGISIDAFQEIKYQIVERTPKKSQILHKIRRIEEFKRNIFVDHRREELKN